jgi:hypothetical protein
MSDKKIIGLSVVYWADDTFLKSIASVIDFVDEMIIWHNYHPYKTSTLLHNSKQHKNVLNLVNQLKLNFGDKIIYHLNKKPYTSVGITDLINKEIMYKNYNESDYVMYVDSDEVFIPEQLTKIKKLVLMEKFDQFKIYQRHYIKYENLWMDCPTNPNQTFLTKNIKMRSYIRNHKNISTFTFPKEKLYYKHLAYCPQVWNDLKIKLIGQDSCESGITIDQNWFNDIFMKITQENYKDFKNFSYIKEFPHHMPSINKDTN